jgi:hypothetical protein
MYLHYTVFFFTIEVMPDITSLPNTTAVVNNAIDQARGVSHVQTIADILLDGHVITQEQYEEAKVKSASESKSIEDVLEEMHIVPEDKMAEAKAKILGVPFISLTNTSFSPQALSRATKHSAEIDVKTFFILYIIFSKVIM